MAAGPRVPKMAAGPASQGARFRFFGNFGYPGFGPLSSFSVTILGCLSTLGLDPYRPTPALVLPIVVSVVPYKFITQYIYI